MIFIFLTYVISIWWKYGVHKSISASYYTLPVKYRFLFTLFCWGFCIPAIIIGTPISGLMFFAGAGIGVVGAAAQINEKYVYKVHMISAVGAVILSQLAIITHYKMPELAIAALVMSIIIRLFDSKTYFWWIELVAFISIIIAMGYKL